MFSTIFLVQLKKIILWPFNENLPLREVVFHPGKVNYIIGSSNTGKSSIWPIIDYCLGSSELRVPLGFSRDLVEWYGIIIQKEKKEYLLARRNNSVKDNINSEWFFLEGMSLSAPKKPKKNSSLTKIKKLLFGEFKDLISKYEDLKNYELDSNGYGTFSYRDLLLLNHLSDFSIINPFSLFISYGSDASKIKLKKLLPYLLLNEQTGDINFTKARLRSLNAEENVLRELLVEVKTRIIGLYNEAQRLGMTNSMLRLEETDKITSCILSLENVFKKNIDILNGNGLSNNNDYREKCFLLGRISEILTAKEILAQYSNVYHDYRDTQAKYLNIKQKLRSDFRKYDKSINSKIDFFANQLIDIDRELSPKLDVEDFSVSFQNALDKVYKLSEIGNVTSIVGYKIASYLTILDTLKVKKTNFLVDFLIIDHLSLSYRISSAETSPSGFYKIHNGFDNIISTHFKGDFQIIILDSIKPKHTENLNNSVVIEEWEKSQSGGLIPQSWIRK